MNFALSKNTSSFAGSNMNCRADCKWFEARIFAAWGRPSAATCLNPQMSDHRVGRVIKIREKSSVASFTVVNIQLSTSQLSRAAFQRNTTRQSAPVDVSPHCSVPFRSQD